MIGEAKVEHLHTHTYTCSSEQVARDERESTSGPSHTEASGGRTCPVIKLAIVVLLAAKIEDHEVLGVIEPEEGGHVCKPAKSW